MTGTVNRFLILASLLALPAGAAASTRSQTVTLVNSQDRATLQPKCPGRQRATGGGFEALPYDGSNYIWIYESRKVGQRSWRVSALKNSAGPQTPLSVTAFVYCAKRKRAPRTKAISKTISVTPGFPPAVASCGQAGRARAGGFFALVTPNFNDVALLLDSSRLGRKSWQSRANLGPGSPTLTSYVYCAKGRAPRARTGSVTATGEQQQSTAISTGCKRGRRPRAGGFSQPDATDSDHFQLPLESIRVGKQWQTTAIHSGPGTTTLSSIAYCA
jgi:hypothetical protein